MLRAGESYEVLAHVYSYGDVYIDGYADSQSWVSVEEVRIDFDFKITDFTVSLEYFVGSDEEEWYGQGVMATIYHRQGSDQIESCIARDPSGNELPINPEWCDNTADYRYFGWFEGGLSNPPLFGGYTITATDKDGIVATVTSWPTDHISDRVPTITDPINHGYVDTGVPTFKWEPFSDRTTGYLVEVFDPSIGETIWAIGLPASQTEVQFDSDGTAAVHQLTPWNTYHLIVFAFEDLCGGIQCYRDTSIRAIEFTPTSLIPGDIVLRRDGLCIYGFWSHCGIYIGNGKVVDAYPPKVRTTDLAGKEWLEKPCVACLRVVTADKDIRDAAVKFALSKINDPFEDLNLFTNKQANEGPWYCSELVWAAYLYASKGQIDLEYTPDYWAIRPDEISMDADTERIGGHCEGLSKVGFIITTKCPVDLEVVDPEGLSVNKQLIEIPEAVYGEDDIDEDGSPEDWIAIPEPKMGNYIIQVVPEPDAEDTDTYTLKVTTGDTTIVLAEDVQIRDIPSKPYVIESTGTTINAAPVADCNGPYAGNEGSQISFDASGSYDPDGSIDLYEWDFDSDGIYDVSSASSTAIFTWDDDHTGTVELQVTDNDGLSGTNTASITVNNVAPTAFFYVEQPADFILPYQSLTFNGASTDAGWLDTHTATWDFGDDTLVSGTLTPIGTTTAEHAYAEPGTYTVTLTVTDDDGGVGDYAVEVTVISAEKATGMVIDQLGSSIVPPEAPKGVSQKIESAIDKLDQVRDFLDQGKYCDAIGKLDGMITQIEGAIDQVDEQKLIESLGHAKQGAIAIRDLISAEHPECA